MKTYPQLLKWILLAQVSFLTLVHADAPVVSSVDVVTEMGHIPPGTAVGPWKKTVHVCGLKKSKTELDCFYIADIDSDQGKICYDLVKLAMQTRLPIEWTHLGLAEGDKVRCRLRSRDAVAGLPSPQ